MHDITLYTLYPREQVVIANLTSVVSFLHFTPHTLFNYIISIIKTDLYYLNVPAVQKIFEKEWSVFKKSYLYKVVSTQFHIHNFFSSMIKTFLE